MRKKGVNDRRKVAANLEKQSSSQRRSSLVRRWWNVPKKLGTRNACNKSKLLKKNSMKEFDYSFDYKSLDFTDQETRKLYRIGRGEQGVLLVRPYTDLICVTGDSKHQKKQKNPVTESILCSNNTKK